MAEEVGRVFIRVLPKVKGFRKKTEAQLKAEKLRDVLVPVKADTSEFERDVKKAKGKSKGSAKISVDADTAKAEHKLDKAAEDRETTIKADTDLDPAALAAKAAAAAKLASGRSVKFRSSLDKDGLMRDALLTSKGIQSLLSQNPWSFKADSLSFRKALQDSGLLAADMGRIKKAASQLKGEFGDLRRGISSFGDGAGRAFTSARDGSEKFAANMRALRSTVKSTGGVVKSVWSRSFSGSEAKTRLIDRLRLSLFAAGRGAGNFGSQARKAGAGLRQMASAVRPMRAVREAFGGLMANVKPVTAIANSMRGFVSQANVVGKAMGVVAASAVGMHAAIVGLSYGIGFAVDALKQLSGVAAVLPGLMGGAALLGATVFAGFRGMGDALKAAVDPAKDLDAAVEGLAPSAQQAARSVRRITPAWQEVAKSVQGEMFAGVGKALETVSAKQLPTVRRGMERLGRSTNNVALSLLGFGAHERTTRALRDGFAATSKVVDNFSAALQPVLLGLQDMGVVGLQALADMSPAWDDFAHKFSNWAGSVEGKNTVRRWIDDGVRGFKDLGAGIGNVYNSFKELGNAFGVSFGGNALSGFRKFSDSFRKWLGSADDANSRVSLFAAKVKEISAPWIDTFRKAWDKLIPAFKELLPLLQEVSSVVAENIGSAIDWVAPKLEGFFKFLSEHKETVGKLVAALLTLRVALGVFKLGRMILAPYIGMFTGLAKLIDNTRGKMRGFGDEAKKAQKGPKGPKGGGGGGYFATMSKDADKASKSAKKAGKSSEKAAKQASKAGKGSSGGGGYFLDLSRDSKKAGKETSKAAKSAGKSAGKFSKLSKGLSKLGGRFGTLGKLASGAGSLLGKGAGLLGKFGGVASKVFGKVGKLGGGLLKGLGKFGKFGKIAGGALKFMAKGALRFIPVLGWVLLAVDVIRLLMDLFPNLGPKIMEGLKKVPEFLKGLLGKLKGSGGKLLEWAKDHGSRLMGMLKQGAAKGFVNVVGWFKSLPGKIGELLGKGKDWAIRKGAGILVGLVEGAKSAWGSVVGWFSSLPGKIGELWSKGTDLARRKGAEILKGLAEGAKAAAGGIAEGFGWIKDNLLEFFADAGLWLWEKGSQLVNGIRDGAVAAWEGFTSTLSELGAGLGEVFVDAGAWLVETGTSIINGLKTGAAMAVEGLVSFLSTIGTTIRGAFLSAGTWLLSAGRSVINGLVSGVRGAMGMVRSACASVKGAVVSFFAAAGAWLVSAGQRLISGLANGVRSVIGRVTSALSAVKGAVTGFFAGAAGWLVASGRALMQGFVNGMLSMKDKVVSTAKGIVEKARRLFPFSPAKEGPFSGKGYTTHSGKALVKDFGKGMSKNSKHASKAAAGVAADTRKALTGGFSGLHGEIEKGYRLDVLEPNARKVAEWRAKEAKANKKLDEQIKNIRKSKSKAATKDKNIAKARARRAKESKESYKQLVESMEKTNFDQIPRSFEKYWIEGTKRVLTRSLSDNIRKSGIVKQVRGAALGAVREGRRVFGKHPIFSTVEKSVNAKHFESVIVKAVEDAGIAEIPVDLVISNLDQFKKDIGLGDGVISRALDQAMKFDPAQTDSRAAREAKTEVHYHVRDMQEAIRLEKLRERKQLMKVK